VLMMGSLYKCDKCTEWHIAVASGFVISESGAAVTSYHVLDPAREALVAMAADGRVFPVREVLAASESDDLAIVQLEVRGPGLPSLGLGGDAPVGAGVRIISHPDNRFYTLTEGIISRRYTRQRAGRPAAAMAVTAEYAKGSSGAPVFDDRGNVVGIVCSTSSIYYNERDGHKENLQMVIRECIPVAGIRKLVVQE
jgi:serine protease Do